ncbi:hypothetical protein F5050DRAFT_1713549 [Lentinula boryana]|uniref:CCHC-type domain-containing protein n=1 Tax=Lentinula boryana TaxID=40481 RepID=A0ABQ8Q7X7_9AGAR|nr:hypothetical protein F5050DRAFT_1713549 [Lentinula boryana]
MSDITLDQLQSALTPEAFNVIAPVFTDFAHRLRASEDTVARLQREQLSMDQLSSSLRDALAHLTIPPAPQAPTNPSTAVARAPLRTELPIFRGRPEENVSAFISIAKDLLKATHIAQEDWGVIGLREQFDHPARTDEIRSSLNRCNYKGNVSEFIPRFQKLEMQLSPADMTFGDRNNANIRTSDPRLRKNTNGNNNHALTGSHVNSSPSSTMFPSTQDHLAPGPMDLDVFTPGGPPVDKSKVRCYNCSKMGHYSKDCRMPRKRTRPSNLPHRPQQPMFHIADPYPLRAERMRIETQPTERPALSSSVPRCRKDSKKKKKASPNDVEKFLASIKNEHNIKNEPANPPLSAHFFNLDPDGMSEPRLPIYVASISGRPGHFTKRSTDYQVHIIADTGASDNYIRQDVVNSIKADIFPLNQPREVIGAGSTLTRAFAKFDLKIGGIRQTIIAYILDKDSGFRYDLLLGWNFLARHGVVFNWNDNTLEMESPTNGCKVVVQALRNPNSLPVQEAYNTEVSDDENSTEDMHGEEYSSLTEKDNTTVELNNEPTERKDGLETKEELNEGRLTKTQRSTFSEILRAKAIHQYENGRIQLILEIRSP